MAGITNLNIRSNIGDIKNLIRIWTPRFLTPSGKITIIKSLLLSKITHVLLSLPTPTNSLMEEIDQMFKDFLWGKKPSKFRQGILELPSTCGGLSYPNLAIFDKTLKA